MNSELKEIMLEKLKEMAELDTDDFDTMAEYNGCCSVMNDVAQTLIDSQQKSDETTLQKVCTPVTEYIKKHYNPHTTTRK